jgi:hypothetical protein
MILTLAVASLGLQAAVQADELMNAGRLLPAGR